VPALAAKEPLVPATACLDVSNGNERLRLQCLALQRWST
jgi:hypothetical protein